MKTNVSRKISIALLISSLLFILSSFILFFPEKGVCYQVDITTNGKSCSLITLAFGGLWNNSSYGYTENHGGNAAIAISFIFVIIVLVLALILLYGYISKKFLPKTCLNLSVVIVLLMLFVSISVCFTKNIAANILSQETIGTKRDYLKYMNVVGNTIALIVFGFLSIASYIGFALIPFIKNKIKK